MAQFIRLADGIDAGTPVETPAFVQERYTVHDPDGPPLAVDEVTVEGDTATVTGTTRGATVVLWTHDGTEQYPVTDGDFEGTVDIGPGAESVTVIAATDGDDLAQIGTTLTSVEL